MRIDPPRRLTAQEIDLVEAMLGLAALPGGVHSDFANMRVVETCDCGCSTFDIEPEGTAERSATRGRILRDAYGVTPDGKAVGLILWGTDDRVTSMELYSLAADPPFLLPAPETVTAELPFPTQTQ